jgi:hypothetical protein
MKARERVWLESGDPDRMLRALGHAESERKLRLFAAACCRRVWPLLRDERSRRAVEVAERHADGLASAEELQAARREAREAVARWRDRPRHESPAAAAVLPALRAALLATTARPARAARQAARAAGRAKAAASRDRERARVVTAWGTSLAKVPAELAPAVWRALALPAWMAVRSEQAVARLAQGRREARERRRQSELLREILGNPFRPARPDPDGLRRDCGAAVQIGQAIYEEQAFEQLPILADALEEAGCTDADLLAHLRGPGPHARGCWALDLVLGLA